jgi:hypothetical protein
MEGTTIGAATESQARGDKYDWWFNMFPPKNRKCMKVYEKENHQPAQAATVARKM